MDDINVVRALLQQQAGGETSVRVPVLEVEVPAVADEMAAPDGLDLADHPLGDQFTHGHHDRHVPHVVAHVQPGPGLARSREQPVTPVGGDRHRFVQEHRYTGLKEVQADLLVRVVRSQHQRAVESRVEQLVVIRGGPHLGAESLLGVRKHLSVAVAGGGHQ